jgi:hypothetical protein
LLKNGDEHQHADLIGTLKAAHYLGAKRLQAPNFAVLASRHCCAGEASQRSSSWSEFNRIGQKRSYAESANPTPKMKRP